MRTEKEILDALRLLKEVCIENECKCDRCVLRNGMGTCAIIFDSNDNYYESLENWNLKNLDNPRLILN